MNDNLPNHVIVPSPYGPCINNSVPITCYEPTAWRPPIVPPSDEDARAKYLRNNPPPPGSKPPVTLTTFQSSQEIADARGDNMEPSKAITTRMVLSPTSQHEITRGMLVGSTKLESFGRMIISCAAYDQQFFELANQVVSIDAKTGNCIHSDFLDIGDALAFSAMQEFFGAANPGTPKPANNLDWGDGIRKHMQKFLRDNVEFSPIHGELVEERMQTLLPPVFGDLDRACDGLVDYVRGVRLMKFQRMMAATPLDPANWMAKLLEVESSIRVPGSSHRWQGLSTLGGFEATPFIIDNLLVEGTVGMIYGPPGDGKTFLALSMASSVASGRAWNGQHTERGGVMYYCLEGGTGFRNRVRALKDRGLLHDEDPFGFCIEALDLRSPAAHALILRDIKVKEAQFKMTVKLIVIDTLAVATSGGNECTSEDMGSALAAIGEVVKSSGVTALLLHHPGKDVSRGPRGWSGIVGNLDTIIEIERSNGLRKAKVTKQKDGQEGQNYTFELEEVILGYNERQKPVTSCVVKYLSEEEAAKASASNPEINLCRLWDPLESTCRHASLSIL